MDFSQRPRSFSYVLYPTSSTRQRLFGELDGIRRFLTEQEKQASEQLYRLIRKKDDLDFHDSRQRVLKLWLFIHIGLTSALMVTGYTSWTDGPRLPRGANMRKLINPDKSGGLQPYDRPNQAWRCGNEENGCPCSVGPTPQGSCPEATECNPVRDGDRWICNRPATRGGPCDDQSPGGWPNP